jgi:hypothetical protein
LTALGSELRHLVFVQRAEMVSKDPDTSEVRTEPVAVSSPVETVT